MRHNSTVVCFHTDDTVSDTDGLEVWPVYETVFGDQPDFEAWHAAVRLSGAGASVEGSSES